MADVQANNNPNLKRKRSLSSAPPPNKNAKTTGQLQINYLARQSTDELPLINKLDTIPNILDVLSSYSSVLDRHESLASNLGARPLAPILIKRFERCFDTSPEIIASHSHARADTSDAPPVTWLEVIHFAQQHPTQFTLSTFSEGRRVCQFYYPQKQVRVQVSEEDFLFIKSGRCQDLIPPLPLWEDEEKEVGTCEIVEKALRELTNAADMVAARTRQLSHRLKGRRMAIMERRAGEDKSGTEHDSPQETPQASSVTRPEAQVDTVTQPSRPANLHTNGTTERPVQVSAPAVRTDLLKHFQSLPHNQASPSIEHRRQSGISAATPTRVPVQTNTATTEAVSNDHVQLVTSAVAPVYQPPATQARPTDPLSYYMADPLPAVSPSSSTRPPYATQSSDHVTTGKHNFSRPLAPAIEEKQPFRAFCQHYMESLPRGSRVMPPCDRCRRLKMDCQKNLTSCVGCTKKHARCHWKDVVREEIEGLEGFTVDERASGEDGDSLQGGHASNGIPLAGSGSANGSTHGRYNDDDDDDTTPLDDLEALGQQTHLDDMSQATSPCDQEEPRNDAHSQEDHQAVPTTHAPVITRLVTEDAVSKEEGGTQRNPNSQPALFEALKHLQDMNKSFVETHRPLATVASGRNEVLAGLRDSARADDGHPFSWRSVNGFGGHVVDKDRLPPVTAEDGADE